MTHWQRIYTAIREIAAMRLMYLAVKISPVYQKHSAATSLIDHANRLNELDRSLKEQHS